MSQSISRIGIDLAKNIFQLCAADSRGKVIFNKKVSRPKLHELMVNTPTCEVIMESCASSNHWARVFSAYGHTVKLINPAYVRPFVKTNKNDAADAEALCEAASRPTMRFVQPETSAQQDIQLQHRVRERLVSQRTALSNQMRGLLAEYGLIFPVGFAPLRKQVPLILEDAENDLSPTTRDCFASLYQEFIELDLRVKKATKTIDELSQANQSCQRLMSIPGVGPMVATAVFAVMGDPKEYRNGREFAAFLGLAPRQYSSGGKSTLKGISKRGDQHTHKLLVLAGC